MMSIVKELKKIKCGKVLTNVSLKEYTTYKIDGRAKVIVFPKNKYELINLIQYIKSHNIPYKILGNGSNLIFVKSVYEGILIKLSEFDDLKINKNIIQVGAGYNLMKLALKVSRMGLTGLEFATGIPGSVGGAIYMNAGAYNSDMGYVVKMVKVLTPNLEIKEMTNREMNFHYRTSFLQKNPGYICLEATIVLRCGNKDIIMEIIKDRKERRLIGQPLEYPSAGSVFRNPPDDYAGRLIEDIGYKGKKIGGAEVSQKHANFIVNIGGATGKDIYDLIMEIKYKVKEKYDIELKVEQEIVE